MTVFTNHAFDKHQLLCFANDPKTGLNAIIAIHNTNRGPALGGCRFWNYQNEQEAINDVLRLSRGMTYKSALANLKLGGGKAVIIGDPKEIKTPQLMQAFGRFVDKLNGLYITAEDVGTSPTDMENIHTETNHVVGLENNNGGSGDPSIFTAYGVYIGIKTSHQRRTGKTSLSGAKVALQGLGHVGTYLLKHLLDNGAEVIVADINKDHVDAVTKQYGVKSVDANQILFEECDILSPCALGGVINDQTINKLNCKVIAGAANNQLLDVRHGDLLKERGILYAPDYLINAGGLINVSYEGANYDALAVETHVNGIHDTLMEIYDLAEKKNISSNRASDMVAESRFMHSSNERNQRITA